MDLTDSPLSGGYGDNGLFVSDRGASRVNSNDTTAGGAPAAPASRVRNLRSRLEATGGVVPSVTWMQQALDALVPFDVRGDNEQDVTDKLFEQALHHDLRSVVDRTSPSRAALWLRNEVRRSLEPNSAGQGRDGRALGVNGTQSQAESRSTLLEPCRLLVQLEDVVNVALSVEARMQRQPMGDSSNHSAVNSSSTSGSRCLKLQLVDGYLLHPLQSRDNDNPRTHNSSSNSLARSSASNVIVAMELSPIPSLSEQSEAGTKLLLTLGPDDVVNVTSSRSGAGGSSTGWSSSLSSSMRVAHGVLLLTPDNCVVVGGRVPELAEEQARQRKAVHERSGASITDPTIRALVSNHYMTDANADDEDVREGESGDVPAAPPAVRTPVAPPVVTPHPITLSSSRTPGGIVARSTVELASGPPSTSLSVANRTPAAAIQTSARPRSAAAPGTANNPYSMSTSMPFQRAASSAAAAAAMPPPPVVTAPMSTSSAAPVRGNVPRNAPPPPSSATPSTTSNPYATKSGPVPRAAPPQRDDGRIVSAGTTRTVQGQPVVRSVDTFSSSSTRTQSTTWSDVHTMAPPAAPSSMPELAASRSPLPPFPSSPSPQPLPFNHLFGRLQSATRHRPLYEQLYGQTVYVTMVQLTPKLHFNIEKVPRHRRQDVSDDRSSQRKHEYVLTARFCGPEPCDDPVSSSITCKLANRVLEPYFLHPPDDLRNMKKTDRARVDEIVKQGGRNLQNWTIQEQLYRVNLSLHPDEFFAVSPTPSLNNDSVPLLLLDAP